MESGKRSLVGRIRNLIEDSLKVVKGLLVDLRSLDVEVDAMSYILRNVGGEAGCGGVELGNSSRDRVKASWSAGNAVETAEDPVSVTGDNVDVSGILSGRAWDTSESEQDTLGDWLLSSTSEVDGLGRVEWP